MKIIDEKGRLFGKINLIDFLVILFLLSFTPVFYFGYKILHSKGALVAQKLAEAQKRKEEFTSMTINCKFIKLKPEVTHMISVGDKELDSGGHLLGEIVSVGEPAPYIHEFDIGSNRKLSRKDPVLQQAAVTLTIEPTVREKILYYKDKQLLEGGAFEFSPGEYSVLAEEVSIIDDNDNTLVSAGLMNAGVKKQEIDPFKKEVDNLKKEVDNLKKEVDNLKKEVDNLKKEDDNLKKEDDNLKKEDDTLRQDLNNMRERKVKKKWLW